MKRVNVNGVELATVDEGRGVPVLLVHGFPLDHAMWQGQIDALKRDFRVIAPDLRGFGASSVTEGTVTMEQFADDLSGLLDQLKVAEPVVYCGLSMGGYIAFEFWRKYRQRVRGLVLCDTKAEADTAEAAQARLTMADKVLKEGPAVAADAMLPKLLAKVTAETRPGIAEGLRQTILNTSPQGIAAAQRGMAERRDSKKLLATIDVPTLVIVGKEDQITTVEQMRTIAAATRVSAPVEVPDAGHMSPLENPAAVNAELMAFLRLV
jgi:pimeloyl-ACP methyl ester carboxylesterase